MKVIIAVVLVSLFAVSICQLSPSDQLCINSAVEARLNEVIANCNVNSIINVDVS